MSESWASVAVAMANESMRRYGNVLSGIRCNRRGVFYGNQLHEFLAHMKGGKRK